MLEFLQQFNNLPSDVKQKVSSAAVMQVVGELEKKYGVPLAAFVIRVMVGNVYSRNLAANLIKELSLRPDKAVELEKELRGRVFASVLDYLEPKPGAPKPMPSVPDSGPKIVRFFPAENKEALLPPGEEEKGLSLTALSGGGLKADKPKPAPKINIPAPSFFEEDEKEVAELSKTLPIAPGKPEDRSSSSAEEVMKSAGIFPPSDILRGRLKQVLSTYLRGVRTKVEVRENLVKSAASGGVNLSPEEADKIMSLAQSRVAEKDSGGAKAKVGVTSGSDGTSFVFNKEEIKQALAETEKNKKEIPAGARDVEYDWKSLKDKEAPARAAEPAAKTPPAAPEAEKPIPMPEKEAPRTAGLMGNKKRMEDIRPAPQVMNPIDELAYMDLVTFRRLNPSPQKRVEKIEAMLGLLEKEGIDKRLAGIKAWRLNPVSKTYLSMGQESISAGRNIEDIIKDRQAKGINYLSRDEFDAVMDLNNRLRY